MCAISCKNSKRLLRKWQKNFMGYFFAAHCSPRGTTLKFGWNRSGVALLRKLAMSLKRGKIGPVLLLMTNRKSHTRFRLVPQCTSLDAV